MSKYIVYLTTNLKSSINGKNKIYIGVHKLGCKDSTNTYLGCGVYSNSPSTYMHPTTAFQKAVKKYGPQAFVRKTLFEFTCAEEAFKKEAELVTIDFLKEPYTYNECVGGVGGSLASHNPEWQSKPIFQFNINGELIHSWNSTLEASAYYNVHYSKINQACVDCTKFKDSYWARTSTIEITKYRLGRREDTFLYSKTGTFLKKFNSRTECAEYLHCYPQSVSKAVVNQSIIKQHYVSNVYVQTFIPKVKEKLKNEDVVYVYNQNGTFVEKFQVKNLTIIIPNFSTKGLANAMYSNNGWYGNYFISTCANPIIKEKPSNNKAIDIYLKETGDCIETLNSLKEVIAKYNLNSAALNRMLKGIKEHPKYIFSYHSK